ncbi:hypothetical protein CDL12_26183 [Handroanthus impetiginosus]|uniref:GTD-binding domain-containing protein n=1 Tax=Handroanthus impetiginosus TaxID=429701 RepID=A0A2G9G7P1_9LAMI|nr:hypothetical protein CDL12_26183 [Handroanthus impetiginosus]
MAAEISSLRKKKAPGFMTLLSSAVCEWFLMFLLFVDAALSYFLTKFAEYCELKPPCILCSRLFNGFGKKKPGWYWSLLCCSHSEEISSLVSCSIHGKFADVNGMCEDCLVPIAVKNKSNSESYRLLVGKSWVDVDRSVLQNLMLNKNVRLGSPDRRMCSCCNKMWRKSNAERLLDLNPVGFGASKANVKPPLPRAPGRSRFSRRDSFKRLRDKFTGPIVHQSVGSSSIDTLSHVGYTKLKISSDSESEAPFSEDDDDGNSGSRGKDFSKPEYGVQSDRRGLYKTPVDKAALEKSSEVKLLSLDQPNLLDLSEQKTVNSSTSDAGDLHWEESYNKPNPSLTPELISLDDGPQPPDVAGDSSGALTADNSKSDVSLPHMPALSVLSELLSLYNVSSVSNTMTITKKINVGGTGVKGDSSRSKHMEPVAGTSSDVHSSESINVNRTDAFTQTDETTELSDRGAFKPANTCDSATTEDEMKFLPQESTPEEGLLSKDASTRSEDKQDEPRIDKDSSSQVLPVSALLKKNNDFSNETVDGITVSCIEGESIVGRLKRQVEHDRNLMNSLYKELEEERNAAAVAVNQAMAMITRLQEEKAALHMEALQYLRMMEEQAEYDMEALERANDLLAEKEKELQDLEIELEFYRNNFLDESEVQNIQKETSIVDNGVTVPTENGPSTSGNSEAAKILEANGNYKLMSSSLSNFEHEKLYLSERLKDLEKKLHQACYSGKSDDVPNGLSSEKIRVENGETLLNQDNERSSSLAKKNISVSNGNPARETGSNRTSDHEKENGYVYEKSDELSANRGEINFGTFEKEIMDLKDRLEAIESDRNFLKHTSDLLRNGEDGLQIVQEIAHHLQELRKMEFEKR